MISTLLLLIACGSNLSERDRFEKQCIHMFEDILRIQDERDHLSNNMQYISGLRKEKSISKKKHKAFSEEWLSKEAYLRDKVTRLYDKTYESGCFEESPGYLEKK